MRTSVDQITTSGFLLRQAQHELQEEISTLKGIAEDEDHEDCQAARARLSRLQARAKINRRALRRSGR